MEIQAYDEEKIEIALTGHEFAVIHQCLNEICNGFVVPDFQRRIGADIEVVAELMRRMAKTYYADNH
jgi:hypothetical protein